MHQKPSTSSFLNLSDPNSLSLLKAKQIEELRKSIRSLGPDSNRDVPRLIQIFNWAATPPPTILKIILFLQHHSTDWEERERLHIRCAIVRAFANMGDSRTEVLKLLQETIRSEQGSLAGIYAYMAHYRFTGRPRDTLAKVRKRLLSHDPIMRASALTSIAILGEAAIPLIPDLHEIIKKDDGMHFQTIEALGAIGPAAKPFLPKIEEWRSESELLEKFTREYVESIRSAS